MISVFSNLLLPPFTLQHKHVSTFLLSSQFFILNDYREVPEKEFPQTNNYPTIEEHLASAFAIINHLPTHTKIMSVSFSLFRLFY